ncbi:MAG: sigma-54-dependent Fis family transcriptional regulator [Myxococcales bacterium]|nr:sigma-54-dependent Fis family transcriptional regulator [Myxococcales bacterium]
MGSISETQSRIVTFGGQPQPPGTAYLLVVENDSSSIVHLPRSGAIVIGRAPEAEVRVQHASVSRRHATIRIDDGVLRIADLGSHNGTRVNGEAVAESRTLASGDVASVGDVMLVVHFSKPAEIARPAYQETGWRRRLIEELERAITFKRSLAVVAVLAADRAAFAALAAHVRLIDVIGHGDDGQALLLLPEVDREQARAIASAAITAASHVAEVRAGLAVCPHDAVDADTILLAARTAARRAAPGTVADAAETMTKIELGDRRVMIADPAMVRVFALLERLAASELPVLVTGETGVGKENAAYAVHHWSKRSGPFIAVNCAALAPESLVDSELFGHDKGAFTGATSAKAGLFESAAGGTVFLDEAGELPLSVQAKLLRALETRKITRIGETKERSIDVRLVAATNRSLEEDVAAGKFRQDLYFRLSGATVILPPLRDRQSEIALLARSFLAEACARTGRAPMTITPAAMQVLLTYPWPGNVRELKNAMEFVLAAAPDQTVEPYDFPERLGGSGAAPAPAVAHPEPTGEVPSFRPIAEELKELERRRMAEALAAARGVKTRAAQLIDMPIRTFTLKLKQYNL